MKLSLVLLGVSLAFNTGFVLAAKQAPVFDVNSTTSSQHANAGTLTEQVEKLTRQLSARNKMQVNMQRQLDELQNEVNELRGVTELHTHQLSQVLERQRELYQELDRRVNEALSRGANQPTNPSTVVTDGSNQVNYSTDLTENEAYDHAVNLVLKDKRYEDAIPAFKRFNQQYPQSSYAPNAHYWLGQLLFNKNELIAAQKEFSIVVSQYKDSSKRSDAILKLAMVAQKQNANSKASALYQQLIKEYPSSTAAQLAKPRLENLSQ